MSDQITLEGELAGAQQRAEAALTEAAALVRELKRVRGAAAQGQVRDLRKSLQSAESTSARLATTVAALAAAYDIDESEHLASGGYLKELLETAADRDVAMFEEDDRVLCYPSILRILPGEAAVLVDKRRERRLRPSVLVEVLRAAQDRGPRFKPEPFLESLRAAYDLLLARHGKPAGAVVRLVDVLAVLTLLPGQSREYTQPEFARDLYLLDHARLTTTKDGRRLRFAASSGTRGAGTLTTVARTGQQQRYWGVAFEPAP